MTKPLYILNGPNLNRLGRRGQSTAEGDACRDRERMPAHRRRGSPIVFRQTNSEQQLIDWITRQATKAAESSSISSGYSRSRRSRSSTPQDVQGADRQAPHHEHTSARRPLPSAFVHPRRSPLRSSRDSAPAGIVAVRRYWLNAEGRHAATECDWGVTQDSLRWSRKENGIPGPRYVLHLELSVPAVIVLHTGRGSHRPAKPSCAHCRRPCRPRSR